MRQNVCGEILMGNMCCERAQHKGIAREHIYIELKALCGSKDIPPLYNYEL